MPRRRVIITGLGTVSCYGVGRESFWQGLCDRRSGIGPTRSFDPSGFPCRHAAEIPEYDIKSFVPKSYRKFGKVMARDSELAVLAAQAAICDAGVRTRGSSETKELATTEDARLLNLPRLGCHIGAGLIAAETDELTRALATSRDEDGSFSITKWGQDTAPDGRQGEGGINNLQPLWMLKYLPNMLACHVTITHGAEGPSNTLTNAEASGILCLGESARVIERDDADACLSGGAESKVNPMGLLRLSKAGRLLDTSDSPDADANAVSEMIRPYEASAAGAVPGEGGAIMLLEGLDPGATPASPVYAEITGFGSGQAPRRIVDDTGLAQNADAGIDHGVRRAVKAAIADAGIGPSEIDLIIPASLAVKGQDAGEMDALRAVLGEAAESTPRLDLTPLIGMCSAGHSALLAAAGALAVREQCIPGVGPAPIRHVLVCSPSIGGQAGAMVLSRFDDH